MGRAKAFNGNGLDGGAGHANGLARMLDRKTARGHAFVWAVLGVDGLVSDLVQCNLEFFSRYLSQGG